MSLIDAFGSDAVCPLCGSAGAKKLLAWVSCPNRGCPNSPYFSAVEGLHASRESAPAPRQEARPEPGFERSAATLKIRYRNHEEAEKVFEGDPGSARTRGIHLSLRVAPSGARIALAKHRILNRAEVEAAVAEALRKNPVPSATERRILAYYSRHGKAKGKSSPVYEELKRKYPGWQ